MNKSWFQYFSFVLLEIHNYSVVINSKNLLNSVFQCMLCSWCYDVADILSSDIIFQSEESLCFIVIIYFLFAGNVPTLITVVIVC